MEKMNNNELLELLKIGDIKGFNEYRKENPEQDINFEGENFDGLDLGGINLRGAILRDCIFDEADLRWASLWGSYFEGATFSGAKLYGLKIDPDGMKMLINCIGIVAKDGWIS